MFVATEWEMFYTRSDKEDFVDLISIDVANKRYILDIDVSDLATDGLDDRGQEICSTYVSKVVFDMIVKGVRENNFTQYKPC